MQRLTLTLAALAALALPASASAYKDVAYSVELKGEGAYKSIKHWDHGDTWSEEEWGLSFEFSGEMNDGVVFRNGSPFEAKSDDLGGDFVAGGVLYSGSGGTTSCTGSGDYNTFGWMRLAEDEIKPLTGDATIYLRPFDRFSFTVDCPNDTHPGVELTLNDEEAGEDGLPLPGKHNFDMAFTLPPEVFGMGYIEQLIPLKVMEGEKCPHYEEGVNLKCRLEWSAKIIFRKLWEKEVVEAKPKPTPPPPVKLEESDWLVPLVKPDPPKPPPPPPPPPASDDEFLVPLVQSSSAKMDAATASVTVSCGGGCAGTASVIGAGSGARAAAASKALATAKFTVPAGKPTKVKVKLGAKARRALRKAKTAKLKLQFTKPARTTKTIVLKLPRRR